MQFRSFRLSVIGIKTTQMRTKGALLLMLCIGFTTVFYCLLSDPKNNINNIVTETHRQLSHLKGVVISGNNDNNDNDINEQNEHNCDKYLRVLGFDDNNQNKRHFNHNNSSPVFVTAINSDQINLAIGFVKSFQDYISFNYSLIIYDLGLDKKQFQLISSICNESQTLSQPSLQPSSQESPQPSSKSSPESSSAAERVAPTVNSCTIRKFNYDIFPSHVSDLKLFAFRPIILQEVLYETGRALWLDPHYYLIPSANEKANQLVEKGRKEGIISWTIDQPTSSLTHPRMFEYFKTPQDNYFFHRMIKPSHILLYNTERIHNYLMLPWVRCALTPECIAPIGSQSSGCRFDKKPLYRYSGCHHYDTSAINVVLGVMFNFNEKPYSANEDDKFFRTISIDDKFDDIYTDDDIVDYTTDLNSNINNKIHNNNNTLTTKIFNRIGWKSKVESLNKLTSRHK